MTKELEALEIIGGTPTHLNNIYVKDLHQDRYNIIEKALKQREELNKDFLELAEIAHNQAKALEIIKRSPVMIICEFQVYAIDSKMSYEEYCNYFSKDEQSIKSKEEYDLLKEVLL